MEKHTRKLYQKMNIEYIKEKGTSEKNHVTDCYIESKAFFDKFYQDNNRHPVSNDLTDSMLKKIERNFGGLKVFRNLIGLEKLDYTTGEERSEKARIANKKAEETQNALKDILIAKFGARSVHTEEPFADCSRSRSDFLVYPKNEKDRFYIDIFYPAYHDSLVGCVNIKLKKYDPKLIWAKIYLVNANPDVPSVIEKKKNKIPKNIELISLSDFIKKINR